MRKDDGRNRTVYLMHFSATVGNALHYLGIARTEILEKRYARHVAGHGANLTARAVALGAQVLIVRTWPNASFELERRLKQNGHFRNLCPVCRPDKYPEALPPLRLIAPILRELETHHLLNWEEPPAYPVKSGGPPDAKNADDPRGIHSSEAECTAAKTPFASTKMAGE